MPYLYAKIYTASDKNETTFILIGYSNHLTSSIESKAQKRGEHPFLLRFIKVLIRKFNLNSKDNEQLPWKFDNEYSKKDRVVRYIATVRLREKDVFLIQTLSQKSKDDISNNLYDLDQILSNLFVEVRPESTEEMEAALKVDYVSLLSHYLPSENDCIWIAIASSLLVFSYLLYTGCLSLWRFLGSLFFISSVWHWIRMYKKALADKHITLSKAKQIPKECSPDSMSWGNILFDSFFIRQGRIGKLRTERPVL